MKLSTDTSRYTTTITKAADFGIQDEDLSHIMGILRSQIYTDKLLAVIREYSTNARDANIEAGNDSAIDITLPTFANPELSFRDYGYGLTDEEVCNLYVKYGASTKRDSNDYTGCLGIGCKAAFAYGDSFTIESYTENRITTWLARIDESKRGTISLLSEKPNEYRGTDTGVKVTVHIRKQDIDECQKTALNFFKFWRPEDITCNVDIEHVKYHTETDDWALMHHDSNTTEYHRYNQHNGKATILMGNIPYPVDTKQCTGLQEGTSLLCNSQVLIKAPLGSLEIAANRESLEYTQKTKESLNILACKLRDDLIKLVSDSVNDQPTRLLASIKAHSLAGILGYTISGQLTKDAKWHGKPLLSSITFNADVDKHYKKKNWRDDTYRNHKDKDVRATTLTPNTRLVLWDSDNIKESNATRRIRTLQEQDDPKAPIEYFVIKKHDINTTEPRLEPDDYINLDDITPLKPKRTIITKADGTKTKSVKISVCHLKPAGLKRARLSKEADPVANEAGQFIYIPLDRFDWVGRGDALDNLQEIQTVVNYLADEKIKIHGVKKHYLKNLDDKWIKLDDYLIRLWKAWTKKYPEHTASLLLAAQSVNHDNAWHAPETLALVDDQAISYTAKILVMKSNSHADIDGNSNPNMRMCVNTLRWLNLIEIEENTLNDIVKNINDQFPMLKEIRDPMWSTRMKAKDMAKELNKYINYCKQS